MVEADVQEQVDPAGDLVELDIVGESYRQDVLKAISGPKHAEGKHMSVGTTLRCEPGNQSDPHAIRVEVMGKHVAYVARQHAAILSPAMTAAFRGVIEAPGMIVGGWHSHDSEGHYGIRVWITTRETTRLGLRPDQLDARLRKYPALPPLGNGERRLGPAPSESHPWATVTCEENYQDAIIKAMPQSWDDHSWPVLVGLSIVADNPYSKHDGPCVGVAIGDHQVGFLTPKMTERFGPLIEAATSAALRTTAEGWAYRGAKRGSTFWRLRVSMPNVPGTD